MGFESREFEGTWEELLKHASEFQGKRVKLQVIGSRPILGETDQRKAWAEFFEEVEKLEATGELNPDVGEAIAEKYRRQGFKI